MKELIKTAESGAAPAAAETGQSGTIVILVLVAIIAAGAAGVFLLGPAQAVQAVQNLIVPAAAPPATPAAESEPVHPPPKIPKPRRVAVPQTERLVAKVSPPAEPPAPPLPAPVKAPSPPPLRSVRIRNGMTRGELLGAWGLPDMKLSAREGGSLVETYTYGDRPGSPGRAVILEDGRVISTGETN